MKPDTSDWNSFLETGKIDDYLNYCQTRKQEMYASIAKGATDASDDRWNSTVGFQDTGR